MPQLTPNLTTLSRICEGFKDQNVYIVWAPGKTDPLTGKFSKHPVAASGRWLSEWQDPSNQITFQQAIERLNSLHPQEAGLGIAFRQEPVMATVDGEPLFLAAVDLDKVIIPPNPLAGGTREVPKLIPWAQEVVEKLASYTEVSPSGQGLRILVFTRRSLLNRKQKLVMDGVSIDREVFCSSQWVTLTGDELDSSIGRIEDRTEILEELYSEWYGSRLVGSNHQVNRVTNPDEAVVITEAERAKLIKKLHAAIPYVETTEMSDFITVMMGFAALRPAIGDEEARRLAVTAAGNAPEETRTRNDEDPYNPEVMIYRPSRMTYNEGAGVVLVRAKRRAIRLVLAELGSRTLTPGAANALAFLELYFRNTGFHVAMVMGEAL